MMPSLSKIKRIAFAALVLAMSVCGRAGEHPRLTFVTPSIVRVQWNAHGSAFDEGNETGVCIYEPQEVKVARKLRDGKTVYRTSELIVEMDNATGSLVFLDRKSGKVLLAENTPNPREHEVVARENVIYDENSARSVETANGQVIVKDVLRRDTISANNRYYSHFSLSADEAIYGLGAHMEDYMNLRGKTLYLCQHNLKTMVPVLLSTAGYGLLFDAGCAMIYSDSLTAGGKSVMTMQTEASKEIDYYFMKGDALDDVVAQYRYLTGGVPMLPRYMTGYVQSRERYVSAHDLLSTLGEFRKRHIPIDVIVQDWCYWPQGWGYIKMDPKRYPDPKAMVDSVHNQNAHIMISIWPNPQGCPEADMFRREGLMLEHSAYNAFSPKGRDLYWDVVNDELFSKGFDAWWCDCSEPTDADWSHMKEGYGWDSHAERWERNTKALTEVCGAERSMLYSLYHSMGIYEHQRAETDKKRVVNLTRSSYAGQQRYSAINWNGDTHASWNSFKQQIPAGLNYMATGNPYWNMDIGCFFTRRDGRWFYKGEYPRGNADPAYRELYTRMFQWGTFLPVMRSHGSDTPREPWFFGTPGTPYYDAIIDMINIRYRLTPYTYSLAAMQTFSHYTMARMLAFDFPHDKEVLDIKDEYMFGDILVCPVTDSCATSRRVYLPDGAEWIDYWTGAPLAGGQWIDALAPINRLPLYVRAGSIIPTTEPAEYTAAQVGNPVTVEVYPGADAEFTLYEDEGDSYNYEKGICSTITLKWTEKSHTLTVGRRKGEYPGMPLNRKLNVKVIGAGEKTIDYSGKRVNVKL